MERRRLQNTLVASLLKARNNTQTITDPAVNETAGLLFSGFLPREQRWTWVGFIHGLGRVGLG